MKWFLENGIYIGACLLVLCMALYAALSSFKKKNMKPRPKTWKDVINNKRKV